MCGKAIFALKFFCAVLGKKRIQDMYKVVTEGTTASAAPLRGFDRLDGLHLEGSQDGVRRWLLMRHGKVVVVVLLLCSPDDQCQGHDG